MELHELETCLSSSKTEHQHIALVTQSNFCDVRYPSSSVLTWPANSPDLNPVDYWVMMQECVYLIPIHDTDELWQQLAETWAEFQQSMVDEAMISSEKDWKHVSMQKVIILNTCCDITCLTFKLSHTKSVLFRAPMSHSTTGSFQSHQHLEENNIPSIRWTSSAFHKVVQWHFTDVVGKFTVTVTVRFILK